MQRILVWDLPIRVFHVLLAATFTVSALLGFFGDDESPIFAAHLIAGLVAAVLVLLRVGWGVVGSRTAGLAGLSLDPRTLVGWFRDVASGRSSRFAGHNPATSYAMLALAVLVPGLAITGVMMARGGEWVEEVHEALAWGAVVVVVAHVAGAVLHAVRHQDGTLSSMVSGRKTGEPGEGIASARPLAAIVLLALVGAWTGTLVRGFDPATGVLQVPVLGALQAVEVEGAEGGEGGEGGEGEEGEEGEDEEEEDDD